ncbi:MAG: threonine--tRNA ligase, partial [Smithella sp.]
MNIKIIFPDNKEISFDAGITAAEALNTWKKETLAYAIAVKINNMPVDLSYQIMKDTKLDLIEISSREGLSILRHSISHVMAQAVQEVFPGAKVSIGPSIDEGFYYDFEYKEPFTIDDFTKIESSMKKIIAANHPFIREELSRAAAVKLFEERGENYKVELINDLPEDVKEVSIYKQGNYIDLCRGPHIPSTGFIKAFKLLSVAGAYWRGNENNKMLQRIYGTGFASENELADYLKLLEEAKKRDHRRLGRELDLFQINEEAGPGLIIFHPKGMMLRYLIEEWERKEHLKRGYDMVMGPQILKVDLWKKSGHFDHYREN